MDYSIFWDFTTAPIKPKYSLLNFVREVEKQFYPDVVPRRNSFIFYINKPYPPFVDASYREKLVNAGFHIVLSEFQRNTPDADSELAEKLLAYLRSKEKVEFIFICGRRSFGPRVYHFLNFYSLKFRLIYNNETDEKFKTYAGSCLSIEAITTFISPPKPVVQPQPDPVKKSVPAHLSNIPGNLGGDKKNISLPVKKVQSAVDAVASINLDSLDLSDSSDNAQEEAPNTFLCIATYDKSKQNSLQSILTSSLPTFAGKLINCQEGIVTISFDAREKLESARGFLESLTPFSLKISSVAPAIVPKKKQNKSRRKKTSTSTSQNSQAPKNQPRQSNVNPSKPQETQEPVKNYPSEKSMPRVPDNRFPFRCKFEFTKAREGFFIILTNLKITREIKWYRDNVRKLLGNLKIKNIYFDPRSSFAVMEFYSKSDQLTAQIMLTDESISRENAVLDPQLIDCLPQIYVDKILNFQRIMEQKSTGSEGAPEVDWADLIAKSAKSAKGKAIGSKITKTVEECTIM